VIKKPGADGKSTVRAVISPAALTVEVPWLLQTNSVVVFLSPLARSTPTFCLCFTGSVSAPLDLQNGKGKGDEEGKSDE